VIVESKTDPYKLVPHVQAFLRSWDPIGVLSIEDAPESAQDEYDSYAPGVLSIYLRGGSASDIADYLEGIRTKNMCVPPFRSSDEAIASEILVWWNGLGGAAA